MDETEEKEGGAISEDEEDEPAIPRDAKAQDEYESKRRKRLELNRKAAQESRRRKKLRIEELQRSVVFLTRENSELREQNELLRQMLATEMPGEGNSANADRFQAENTALKLALYESVQNLTRTKQGLMNQQQQQAASNAAPIAAAQGTASPANGGAAAGQAGVQLSQMPTGLPAAPGILGGSQGVNMAGMVDALNAGRIAAMPHMMGLTPAMLMARQQSAAAMLGMANAQQQQLADAAAFQQQQLARATAAATAAQPTEATPAPPASDVPPSVPSESAAAPPAVEDEQSPVPTSDV